MQYIQSLPEDEKKELMKKMQGMRSEAEAKRFFKELAKKAKAAGFEVIKK